MVQKLFGTDGIRGRANSFPMTADIAMRAAMVAGAHFKKAEQPRVVLGKDTRQSCYMLEQAMTAGFCAVGLDVILLGPLPTPAVAMVTKSMRADLGVMISASHNAYTDNGIKFFGPDGYKLSDEIENVIECGVAKCAEDAGESILVDASQVGRAKRLNDVNGRYVEAIKRSFPSDRSLSGLRVIVDCAHGAAYQVAPTVLWELGAEVITIGDKPNGTNINREVGATHPRTLADAVKEYRADIGIALDGDADRLILVDEKGTVVDGDQIMAMIANSWAQRQRLHGGGIAATVMSNMGLERFLKGAGIDLHRTKVGDRHVLEAMRKKGLNFGGEQSGHMILGDYATTGDGLLAAVHVLAEMETTHRPASEALRLFDPLPQVLKSVRFKSGNPLKSKEFLAAKADAEAELGDGGRLVVRKSGTEPVIRVMAEGDDISQVTKLVDSLCDVVTQAA